MTKRQARGRIKSLATMLNRDDNTAAEGWGYYDRATTLCAEFGLDWALDAAGTVVVIDRPE